MNDLTTTPRLVGRWPSRALAFVLGIALASLAHAHDTPHDAQHAPAVHAAVSDLDAIHAVLMKTWDQPQARLRVEPVVIRGDVAIAGWQQGERGGRALLRKPSGAQGWIVAICAGDGLKDVALLRDVGVPAADADALVQALAQAEARLDPTALTRFASFDGLVRMDEHGNHPPGHGANAHDGHGSAHGGQHDSNPGGDHAHHPN
jgi:hypothetical protein